jgi:DNA-directed RNA polymerase beta subunit
MENGVEHTQYRKVTRAEAYLRKLDYRVMIRVNVTDHGKPFIESQLLCFLPLMIGSAYDPSRRVDEGGSFVIEGCDKMARNPENQRPDSPHFICHDKAWRCEIVSSRVMSRHVIYDSFMLQVMHICGKQIKLVELLFALGARQPLSDLLTRSGDDLRLVRFVTKLMPQMGSGLEASWGKDWRSLLSTKFLPHLGITEADDAQKLYWVLKWARELVECIHDMRPATDRDHLAEKRITTAGGILDSKFTDELAFFWTECAKIMTKHENTDIRAAMTSNMKKITTAVHEMMRTGNVDKNKVGFIVPTERNKTSIAYASNPRKTHQFMPTRGRQFLVRAVHGSHWGMIDTAETPSADSIGLTKTPAQTVEYTVRGDEPLWLSTIADCVEPWQPGDARVMLNGRILGKPRLTLSVILARLMELRKQDPHAVVTASMDEINVDISPGRWVRPLWRRQALIDYPWLATTNLEAAIPRLPTLKALIQRDCIEYLDASSEAVIAISFAELTPECTHVELDPSLLLGETAAQIPFVHHTPAPRISFQAGMAAQAVDMRPYMLDGETLLQYKMKASWETTQYYMWYGQKPLNPTWAARRSKLPPSTFNALVLFMALPNNQEDNTIVSRQSVEMGMGRCDKERVYTETCYNYEVFGVTPDAVEHNPRLRKVRDGGLPAVGMRLRDGDAVACRTDPKTREHFPSYFHGHDDGIVTEVLLSTNMDGHTVARIKLQFARPVIVGNKLSTRHGQKGTVGQLMSRESLPFTHGQYITVKGRKCFTGGVTPDIIMNNHAIPSRMTIGQMIEMREGKAAAMAGVIGDSTAHWPIKSIRLKGLVKTGEETFYNGETGELISDPLFFGFAEYEVLRHFVIDKSHARPMRGPINLLTRQPLAGRSQMGGFRNGQMEQDAMLAHGATALLHERFFTSSDGTEINFCHTCGTISWINADKEPTCGNRACGNPDIFPKYSGHSFLYLMHELRAVNIVYSVRQ